MDGEPPQEEDFSLIPLIDRSQHKNWKARLSAYTEAIAKAGKTASDTDPFFRPYISDAGLLKKWCLDANVVAQEKGIEAVLAIVQYSGESSSRTRSDVVPALVEKALGSVRAGTRKKGIELCGMYVEVENSGDGVAADVLAGLDSKQPKVVAGSLSCLKELVDTFGTAGLGNVKPVLKGLAKAFAHSDKTVRAEATALTTSLYPFLGAALLPSISDLKPLQITELQKSFDSLDAEGKGAGTGRPTRWTRKVQREREEAEAAGVGGDGGSGAGANDDAAGAVEALDARSLLDPVDVLSKFPSELLDLLASTKWKERLEALEACNTVLADPKNARISESNVDAYGGLAQTLGAKCKGDANVNVVMEAAKVIEGLAKGIGKPFGRYRSVIMPGVMERLKERKANVVEALGKALDALFQASSLGDMNDDVLTSLKSKNPQVKEGTLRFLHRSLQTTRDAPAKDHVKPTAELLVSLLADSAEPIRASAAECLGTMMKILGERAFNPYVEKVGELQMAKVKDAFARAEIQYRPGGAGPTKGPGAGARAPTAAAPAPRKVVAPKPPTASTSAGSSSPPITSSGKFDFDALDEFAPPTKAPPARFAKPAAVAKTTPASPPKAAAPPPKKTAPPPTAPSSAKPAPASKAGPSKTLASSPSEPVKYRFSSDDAAAQAAEVIPARFHSELGDAAWKVRLEAAEALIAWVGEEGGAEKVESEVMMRFLGKTPGWGEKNFQVSAKVYQIMQLMAEKSPTFGKPSAALCIGQLTDKLGDMKLKKPSGDALTAFAEKTSLAFVLAQGYEPMSKQKAPKAQADALTWIKQQLNDFGIAGIPLRELVAFVKSALGSPNALVRASATQLLVTIRVFVGGDISGFLEDVNPQLLATINSEFDKAASQTPPEPTKSQADLQEVAAGSGKSSGKAGSGDPLDDLIPRVDLDKLVNSTSVIADSRADAWKVRKEAFEALNTLLEVKSNSRLKPNMGEISSVLKKAMVDTNLAVKMLALGIISKIAAGMGPAFDKHAKVLTAAVASVCADQKATTRTAAVTTLSSMADAAGGLDGMYSGLATSLETPNPALRAAVLGWLAERLPLDPPTKSSDMTTLAGPIISCLEDRNGDVRKGAGAVLPFLVSSAGYEFVMDRASSLKPASKATIVPLIEKARANAPAPSGNATVPAAAPITAKGPAVARVAKAPGTPGRSSGPGSPAAPAAPAAAPARTIAAPARSLAMKALSSAPVIRPPTKGDERPSGIPKRTVGGIRPTSSLSAGTSSAQSGTSSSSTRQTPFLSDAPEPRALRLKKDSTRWILEPSPKVDMSEYLYHQMEHHTPPELHALLFSKDHRAEEDFMAALSTIADFYDPKLIAGASTFGMRDEELRAVQLANVDLAIKYAALKLISNNTQLAYRSLEVMSNVIDTVARYNERFNDAEAKLFVPALVFKLGDAKFGSRLAPVFDSLDKIIAASQVVQLLIQYGLEDKSAGKTCKNESLQLIEKAYKKRGAILRNKDDKNFYEAVARCIADSGTRSAALSVMALLQLQGGSPSLNTVIDSLPQGSKDMLANRKATMATAKSAIPAPRSIPEPATTSEPLSPSKLTKRPVSIASPAALARPESPARSIPRSVNSPISRLPKSAVSSPSISRTTAAAQPRSGIPQIASRMPKFGEAMTNAPRPSMMPIGRGPALPPIARAPAPTTADPISSLINAIRQEDLDRSVEALKQVQLTLDEDPAAFKNNVVTLVDAMLDKLDQAFTPKENLRDPQIFRLVKHIINSFSGLTQNAELVLQLSYDDIYTMLREMSLRLVQADRMGGHIPELSKFMNMIIITLLATPDRLLVFRAMFKLFYALTKDFTVNHTAPDEEVAAHADLILKCLWKRCKILDEDLKTGRLKAGPLLGVLEDFLRGVGPQEYRRRAQEGIALADLPLRTVKTIIQRVMAYGYETNHDIYDIVLEQFGQEGVDTFVYSYIFRLVDIKQNSTGAAPGPRPGSYHGDAYAMDYEPEVEVKAAAAAGNPHDRQRSRPTSLASTPRMDDRDANEENVRPAVATEKNETGVQQLVRDLKIGNQSKKLDNLYEWLRANPDKEDEMLAALGMHTDLFSLYVKRMLNTRKERDNPAPAPSPLRSPARPTSLPPQQSPGSILPPIRRGTRPSSLAVDKTATAEDQLAQLKNVFAGARAGLSASQSAGGEPLSEIVEPQTRV